MPLVSEHASQNTSRLALDSTPTGTRLAPTTRDGGPKNPFLLRVRGCFIARIVLWLRIRVPFASLRKTLLRRVLSVCDCLRELVPAHGTRLTFNRHRILARRLWTDRVWFSRRGG